MTYGYVSRDDAVRLSALTETDARTEVKRMLTARLVRDELENELWL